MRPLVTAAVASAVLLVACGTDEVETAPPPGPAADVPVESTPTTAPTTTTVVAPAPDVTDDAGDAAAAPPAEPPGRPPVPRTEPEPEPEPEGEPDPAPEPEPDATVEDVRPGPDEPPVGHERPDWLGTRPLPLRPDGLGEIQPTPPELVDRQLATPSHLPPPPDESFHATIEPVPDEVRARSTWRPECPVGLAELRYVTVSFWGFDRLHHRGELLVHRDHAEGIVAVFERLHEDRFPIEEMRITRSDELDAHPTGDGNNTGAFVCRPTVGATSWSQHAYGAAVDVNPFHNPLARDDIVIPELASAYVDRNDVRPGMILPGDVVTTAFAELGWGWGGNWSTSKDWMHFSATGR
jgi:hypothetical protein